MTKKKKQLPPPPNLNKAKWHFETVYKEDWVPPKTDDPDFGTKLLTMPNIPKPLHSLAPRTLVGATAWNYMRKQCYKRAGERCEICGCKVSGEPGWSQHQAHEVYKIDCVDGTSKLKKVVCLCKRCHLLCIHTGRALTLYKNGVSSYNKEVIIDAAKFVFSTMYEYNTKHPDEEPLRPYKVWIDFIDEPELHDDLFALAKKYNMSFWVENPKTMAKWSDWKLIFDGKEHPTPFADEKEWEEAMAKNNRRDDIERASTMTTAQQKMADLLKELKSKKTIDKKL